MIKKIASISVIALSSVFMTGIANAHDGGFVMDSSGKGVIDSYGKCIKSVSGNAVDGCTPKKEVKKEVKKEIKKVEPKKQAKPKEKAPEPVVEAVTESAVLSDAGGTHFKFDSARLSKSGKTEIDALLDRLADMGIEAISIVGHTDSTGSAKYNQRLSERRAKSVAGYMIHKGIDGNLVNTSGRGESKPTANNKTRAGRAQNRRVEIIVTGNRIIVK